tara:strand:- start:1362 stop:1769 length:408 start_codon:yes stop_codon:yes gene_type:complete
MFFNIENIFVDKKKVAKIFRYKKKKFKGIKFFTSKELNLQVGFMSHNSKHKIQPHYHLKRGKIIKDMSEFLIIFKGKLRVLFYNKKKIFVKSIILNSKDMILIISGSHGFEVLKKTEMLEVKQGPFVGEKDKKRF